MAEIENLNSVLYRGVIELPLPARSQLAACLVNGRPAQNYTVGKRYRASAVTLAESVMPGARFRLEIAWRKERV